MDLLKNFAILMRLMKYYVMKIQKWHKIHMEAKNFKVSNNKNNQIKKQKVIFIKILSQSLKLHQEIMINIKIKDFYWNFMHHGVNHVKNLQKSRKKQQYY